MWEGELSQIWGIVTACGIAAMTLLNICSPFEGSGPHQRDTNDHLAGLWGGWKSRGHSEASWHHRCPYTRSPEGYNEGLWHWWVLGLPCLFAEQLLTREAKPNHPTYLTRYPCSASTSRAGWSGLSIQVPSRFWPSSIRNSRWTILTFTLSGYQDRLGPSTGHNAFV